MSIPLSTIKSALKIDYDDDDLDLIRLRESASSLVERRTGVSLSPRSETLYISAWTATLIPGYPFTSVTSVTYTNASGSVTTMPTSDWWVDLTDGPCPIIRFLEAPELLEGTAITVSYSCGYTVVPNELIHAQIALIGAWYNNPEALQPIGLSVVPLSLEYILESYSVRSPLR